MKENTSTLLLLFWKFMLHVHFGSDNYDYTVTWTDFWCQLNLMISKNNSLNSSLSLSFHFLIMQQVTTV